MPDTSKKEKYILLDNLFNLFHDLDYQKDEEISKDEKGELDKIINKNILLFRKLKTQTKAELNRAKYNRVMKFLSDLKTGVTSNSQKYQKIVDEIFAKSRLTTLQPIFKNLNKISDVDKKAMIIDDKLLNLLSEIEEEYTKNIKNG